MYNVHWRITFHQAHNFFYFSFIVVRNFLNSTCSQIHFFFTFFWIRYLKISYPRGAFYLRWEQVALIGVKLLSLTSEQRQIKACAMLYKRLCVQALAQKGSVVRHCYILNKRALKNCEASNRLLTESTVHELQKCSCKLNGRLLILIQSLNSLTRGLFPRIKFKSGRLNSVCSPQHTE